MPLTDGSLSSKASWGRIRSWWTSVVQHPFSQRLPASLSLPVPTHLHKTTDTQTHKLGSAPSLLFLSSTYLSFYLMCVCISIHVLGALHMNITRWSTLKSDWLYSLQPKKEKLYTVRENKTGSWLWLWSWTPYCQNLFQVGFLSLPLKIWATVSSRSCFCWLYTAPPHLTAKNIINLISVLTIWWCPCVELSLVLLEESVCYDHCILLAKFC